jgi:hypothetical protein
MRRVAIAFQMILFFVATALSSPTVQKESRFSVAGLDDEVEVVQFFISFKEAIEKGNKEKVASLVSYPIKVNLASGRWKRIRNAADFIKAYDSIFDGKFRRLIIETDVKNLWAKSSGVAMPRGEIWFNGIVKDANKPERYSIRITAINGRIRS